MAAEVWSIEHLILPTEIILDIISRLPAESVIQCKLVCRSWRLHLNSRQFSTLHLHQQQQQIISRGGNQLDFITKFNPDGFGIIGQEFEFLEYQDHGDDGNYDRNKVVVAEDDDDEYSRLVFGNYRVRKMVHRLFIDYCQYIGYVYRRCERSKKDYFVQAVGSCNGLVCLGCFGDPMYVCNPVTSEYIIIPRHGYYHYHNKYFPCRIVSGFGYCPSTDEYKVIRIYYEESNINCKGQVEVYTLGKDCGRWRDKGQISVALGADQRGILVNGTLYWMSITYGSTMHDHDHVPPPRLGIVALDLAHEEFYEVAEVPILLCEDGPPPRIRELGGCLCIINVAEQDSTDVWMMKKNSTTGNNGNNYYDYSWVKEFRIPQNWTMCDPFTLTKNGEILAWYNHQNNREVFLVRYNPQTGKLERHVDESSAKTTINIRNGAVPHIKSFISLKDLGEEGARLVERHKRVRKFQMPLKRKTRRASSCMNFNVFSED